MRSSLGESAPLAWGAAGSVYRFHSDLRPHNLKVIGSNPIPATTFVITYSPSGLTAGTDPFLLGDSGPDEKWFATRVIRGRERRGRPAYHGFESLPLRQSN